MLIRKKIRSVWRGTTIVLAVALLTGCATQNVQFTSIPPGATISVGEKRGVTPCTIRVAKEEGPAVFRLSSGAELVLPLHGLDSHSEESAEASGKVFGGVLMGIGGVVGITGGLVVLAVVITDGDDDDAWPSDEEDDGNDELLGYGFATMLCGGAVFALGKWIYPDDQDAVIHADFRLLNADGEPGVDEDTIFEDTGYGARRLK